MFQKLLGPKYTLKDALLILEKGLRNGDITLKEEAEVEASPVKENLLPSTNMVFVGNLPYAVTDFDLQTMFEPFGKVESAQIALARGTERTDRFGLVRMSNADGRRLIVNQAWPR